MPIIDRGEAERSGQLLPDVALRVLSEHVSDGVTIQDGAGRVVYSNEAAALRAGYRGADDLLANPAAYVDRFDLFDERGLPLAPGDLPGRRVLEDGQPERKVVRFVDRASGEVHWSIIQADPVWGPDGGIEYVVNTIQDVTSLKVTEARLRRREEAARFLAEAAKALTSSLDPEATLSKVASLAVPRLADWCVIDLVQPPDRLEPVVMAHTDPTRVEQAAELMRLHPPSRNDPGGAWAAIETRTPVTHEITDELLEESISDPEYRAQLRALGVRSVIAVPLRAQGKVLGAITLAWSELGRTHDPEEVAVVEELAAHAGLALENARLYADRDRISRTLQTALLPGSLPEIEGFELAARYWPAGPGMEVGGDFYDAFERPDGSFGLVVGDVCGKGAEAAAIMGKARQTVRAAGVLETRPSAILAVLNEALLRDETDLFCTACDVRVYPGEEAARLSVCLAGHPAPLVARADGTVGRIGRYGTALGLFPAPRLTDSVAELRRGDSLVLFTDGLVERRGLSREDDLMRLLETQAGASAPVIVSEIERWWRRAQRGETLDDAVVLVLKSV